MDKPKLSDFFFLYTLTESDAATAGPGVRRGEQFVALKIQPQRSLGLIPLTVFLPGGSLLGVTARGSNTPEDGRFCAFDWEEELLEREVKELFSTYHIDPAQLSRDQLHAWSAIAVDRSHLKMQQDALRQRMKELEAKEKPPTEPEA